MDYKKKYLKYKLKYLQAKKTFKGGMHGEEKAPAEEEEIIITVYTDAEPREISVRPKDAVHNAIAAAFGRQVKHIEEALLGNGAVESGYTFEDYGIEDGARLSVRFRAPKTFEEFVAEMIELNPNLTREDLMRGVEVAPLVRDASRVKGSVWWDNKRIAALPESIGDLTVDGNLQLNNNQLKELPASFGSLTVGGSLDLGYNNLATLPASFGSLTVGGHLSLKSNNLSELPANFSNIDVRGRVFLNDNPKLVITADELDTKWAAAKKARS